MPDPSPKTSVLIIDDEPDVTHVLESRLTSWGFRVEVVSSGGEAIRRLTAGRPDFVICDVNLPDMSGREVLRRSEESGWEVPFLILSGQLIDSGESRALRQRGHQFLLKPFEVAELDDCVQGLLKRSKDS